MAIPGCENESPDNIAEIKCSVTSKSLVAFTGNLVFDRAYVHLNKVEVSGTKNGISMNASTSFTQPEEFFFIGDDPRQPIKVPIAEAIYGDPEVRLYFHRDPYVLQLKDTTYQDQVDNPTDDGESDDDESEGDSDNGESDGDSDDGDQDDDDDSDEEESDGDENDNDGDDDNDAEDEGEEDDDGRKSAMKGKTVNLAEFISHAKPSIVLFGNLQTTQGPIKVFVAVDISSVRLTPELNSDSLVVRKTNDISAQATFQPGLWFGSITQAEIMNSVLIDFKGETVLFIHKDFNALLHAKITSAIEASTELLFQIDGEF